MAKSDASPKGKIHEGWFDAIRVGDASALRRMIREGQDVEARGGAGGGAEGGAAVLAAEWGEAECLGVLIEAGADVEARDEQGATPALRAAASGAAECLRLLIEAGADVQALNARGKSALDVARGAECVELLSGALAKIEARAIAESSLGALDPGKAGPLRM